MLDQVLTQLILSQNLKFNEVQCMFKTPFKVEEQCRTM